MPRMEIPEELLDSDGFLAGRFISPSSRYNVQVVQGVEQTMMDSRGFAFSQIISQPILAQFETSGLREHELETAFETFNFTGLPEGVNPVTRIAVYDPEAQALAQDWTDETRKAVERKLYHVSLEQPGYVKFVPSPRAPRPWNTYDHDSVEEILHAVDRYGYDPDVVRLYEVENKNRSDIVDVLYARQEEGDHGYDPETEVVGSVNA